MTTFLLDFPIHFLYSLLTSEAEKGLEKVVCREVTFLSDQETGDDLFFLEMFL